MGFAGDSFNTLWALRALTDEATPADYVSAFGDDPFSHDQIAFLADAGIGTASSPIIAGARPGLYAITLTGAERSFTYWRADAAARRLADDPAALAKSLENRALVYFSGITSGNSGAGRARSDFSARLPTARTQGSLIAFDPNYRPRLWPDAEDGTRGDRRGARPSSTSRCRHSPTSRRCSATPTRSTAAMRMAAGRRRRGRRQERRGAGAGVRPRASATESVAARTSPRPSTRPAPATPSTAAISPRGLPASNRPKRPDGRSASPRRWCRCAARWRRSRRCGKRSALPEPVFRHLPVDLARPQHRLREIRPVGRIRPDLRLQAEAGASARSGGRRGPACSRATLWPA